VWVSIHFCVDADARVCVCVCVCVNVCAWYSHRTELTPELKVQKKALQKKPVPCLQAQFVRF